jgi:tripartite motif-containing protein 71
VLERRYFRAEPVFLKTVSVRKMISAAAALATLSVFGLSLGIATSATYVTSWGSYGSGLGQFDHPGGVAVAHGRVYVADTGNSRIEKFTSGGEFRRAWGSHGSRHGQSAHPGGIAVAHGRVYVANTDIDRIAKFTSQGKFLRSWGSKGLGRGQLGFPHGVAVDARGHVYVADSGNDRIEKFSQP